MADFISSCHQVLTGKLAEAELLMQSRLTTARSDLDAQSNNTRHLYQQLQEKENVNAKQLAPPESLAGTTMDFVVTRSDVGYGFSVEGGHGLAGAAAISKVLRYGPSDIVGMKAGDVLMCVNDRDILDGTHKEVVDLVRRSAQPLKLTIYRPNKQFDGLLLFACHTLLTGTAVRVSAVEDDDGDFEETEHIVKITSALFPFTATHHTPAQA